MGGGDRVRFPMPLSRRIRAATPSTLDNKSVDRDGPWAHKRVGPSIEHDVLGLTVNSNDGEVIPQGNV